MDDQLARLMTLTIVAGAVCGTYPDVFETLECLVRKRSDNEDAKRESISGEVVGAVTLFRWSIGFRAKLSQSEIRRGLCLSSAKRPPRRPGEVVDGMMRSPAIGSPSAVGGAGSALLVFRPILTEIASFDQKASMMLAAVHRPNEAAVLS